MTREEVVKWLESLKKEIGKAENRTLWHYAKSIDMAIEALNHSVFPNSSDLISRQDAIKAVANQWLFEALAESPYVTEDDLGEYIRLARELLKDIPSADRPTGEWIMHGEPPWYVRECSKCGTKWHQWSGDSNPNYCGHCGAKMRGEDSE